MMDMEHLPRRMETPAAVQYALEHAGRTGLSLSPEQALLLIERHELHRARAITRAVALLHAYTTSGALDELPAARGDGVLRDAPSIVLAHVLHGASERERQVLFSLCLVPSGLELDDLRLLFEDTPLTTLMQALQTWVRRRIVVVHEAMAWRVPTEVAAHIDTKSLVEDERAMVRRHGLWCAKRFGYEPLRLYETFPSTKSMASLWAWRETLLGLTRAMLLFDGVGAARVLITFAPASLSLGGRAALEELATHIDLCLAREIDARERFHLLLLRADLLFRQRGELSESLENLEMARALLSNMSPDRDSILELCLLQREIVYLGLQRAHEPRDLIPVERLMTMSAHPKVPGFLLVQALRLSHRVHDELGHDERARHLLERAIREAQARGLIESVLLCKMELLNSMLVERDLPLAIELATELLAEIDPAHAPRMYFITKSMFGYALYMQGERLGEASFQLEQAIDYMQSARDARSLTTAYQVLALCELEQGRQAQALSWQERVGWPLYAPVDEQKSTHWWMPVLGALVYAWCGERFLTQRMMLDAQRHVTQRGRQDRQAWIVDWVAAMVDVIWCVQEDREVASAMHRLRRARAQGEQQEHVVFTASLERHAERWLNTRGHTMVESPCLRVDAFELPAQFIMGSSAEAVSLARRKAMRHILGALIARHRDGQRAQMLSTDEVFEAGWPGDIATPESQRARVYNTLSRMRKLGLDEIIVHDGDGYGLAPNCQVTLLAGDVP